MSVKIKSEIKGDELHFIIAGIDILKERGNIKARKEIDDFHFSDVDTIEFYNDQKEFAGEVSLSVVCQFLEIPYKK